MQKKFHTNIFIFFRCTLQVARPTKTEFIYSKNRRQSQNEEENPAL